MCWGGGKGERIWGLFFLVYQDRVFEACCLFEATFYFHQVNDKMSSTKIENRLGRGSGWRERGTKRYRGRKKEKRGSRRRTTARLGRGRGGKMANEKEYSLWWRQRDKVVSQKLHCLLMFGAFPLLQDHFSFDFFFFFGISWTKNALFFAEQGGGVGHAIVSFFF